MRIPIVAVLLTLFLTGCPQPDDPGPKPVSPEPSPGGEGAVFPAELPTPAERIEGYVRWLEYGNARQLGWALASLKAFGEKAVPFVVRFLEVRGHDHPHVVANALRALEAIGAEAGTEAAAVWAKHTDSGIRERAMETVAACGGAGAAGILVAALDDLEPRVAGRALNGLGRLRPAGAVKAILARRERYGSGLAALAANALGVLGSPDAIPWLAGVVEDSSRLDDRIAAAIALHALGDDRGLDRLADEAAAEHDPMWSARVSVLLTEGHGRARALLGAAMASDDPRVADEGRLLAMGHPELGFPEHVLSALDSGEELRVRFAIGVVPEWLRRKEEAITRRVVAMMESAPAPLMRAVAARALVDSGRPELLDRVAASLRDRPGDDTGEGGFAIGAGRALARAGDAGRARLVPLLASDDPATRRGALDGIARVGGPEAIEAVARLLLSPDRSVRRRAAAVLARMGSVEAIPALREAHRRERDPELRAVYARGARAILGPAAGVER